MKKYIILMSVLVLVLGCISPVRAADTAVNISPNKVDIGLNFKGAELALSGTVPRGADVYIKVASPDDSVLQLSKKGKVALFWMNVENTNVTNVPKLYQILSSRPLSQVPEELRKKLGIDQGYSHVYAGGKVEKHSQKGSTELSKAASDKYIDALIDIYKKSGLYVVKENSVKTEGNKFQAKVVLPPNIPQENCNVTVYAIKNGKLISSTTSPFKVSSVGVVNWLNKEAIYDGPTYGFIAVLIALFCGTAIALIFSYAENLLSGGKKTGFNPGAGH